MRFLLPLAMFVGMSGLSNADNIPIFSTGNGKHDGWNR
jgi:hypothetical protein